MKKIDKCTTLELKAEAYDTIKAIELLNQKLQIINNEVTKREMAELNENEDKSKTS